MTAPNACSFFLILAAMLLPGDVLSLADGGTAVVTAKMLECAPAGQTFTTYNFEVEGYHTRGNGVSVQILDRAFFHKADF